MTKSLNPGPLMIDVDGLSLSSEDRDIVSHPAVGGIILFSRNFASRAQLVSLIADIRASRHGELVIAVDHEGGRVQRFRQEFTVIPAMQKFGDLYDLNQAQALQTLRQTASLMASELADCDIDFTYAPVVDIDHGLSEVIGDRALHHTGEGVVDLATALIEGFNAVGCACVLKHYPGHGGVVEDTHLDFAHDHRSYNDIASTDQLPFEKLAAVATAVMSSHVVYDAVDTLPASLSRAWLTDTLRNQLGFQGAIISDDLSMAAVAKLGSADQTTQMAIDAGSDLILICNDRNAVTQTLDSMPQPLIDPDSLQRRLKLKRKPGCQVPAADQLAAVRQMIESMA